MVNGISSGFGLTLGVPLSSFQLDCGCPLSCNRTEFTESSVLQDRIWQTIFGTTFRTGGSISPF